jgi:hypothetical protein
VKIKTTCINCKKPFTFDPHLVQQVADMMDHEGDAKNGPTVYMATCPDCQVQQRVTVKRR